MPWWHIMSKSKCYLHSAKAEVQQEQKHEKHYMSDNQESKYHNWSCWTPSSCLYCSFSRCWKKKSFGIIVLKHSLKKSFTARGKYFMQCKNHPVLQDSKQAVPERTSRTVIAEGKVTLISTKDPEETRNVSIMSHFSFLIFH